MALVPIQVAVQQQKRNLCLCGCGKGIPDRKRYVPGHRKVNYPKNRKRPSAETRKRMSAGMKRFRKENPERVLEMARKTGDTLRKRYASGELVPNEFMLSKGKSPSNKGKRFVHAGSFKKGHPPLNNGKGCFEEGHVPAHKGKSAPWAAGKNNHNYKDGRSKGHKCLDCSKIIDYRAVRCQPCRVRWYRGSNNTLWKGGREPYPEGWTRALTESIRQRDSHKCRICSKTQRRNGKRLSVHHIDYDFDNLDPKNLITLCTSCHSKTNAVTNHKKWSRYFRNMLRGRKEA